MSNRKNGDSCVHGVTMLCKYCNQKRVCPDSEYEVQSNDGIYMQLFCVKNGVRYDMKVIDLKEVSTTLTNSLMDGIEKLCQ